MTSIVRKAIFPVAGLGTRFLPATKANPKEMLPIVDKPLIQYAVEEAIGAGITELIFITNHSKRAIEDHFDVSFELEHHLKSTGKEAQLKEIREIVPEGVTCIYLRQAQPMGLGHAVLCAKEVIGDEPFAVILADDLIDSAPSCLAQMLSVYDDTNASVIAVEKILKQDADKYGIVEVENKAQRISNIRHIVEKPSPDKALSDLGVVGRYILNPEIFEILDRLYLANRKEHKEFDLTTPICELLKAQEVFAYLFQGKRYDCGSKLGYLKACIQYGLKHPELGHLLKTYLQSVTTQKLEADTA